jgi:hypothetical protein
MLSCLSKETAMLRSPLLATAAAAVLLLLAVPGSADDAAALGTWDMVALTPNGPLPAVMTLAKVEGRLKAEVELGGLKRTVTEEKLDGDALTLNVEYEGIFYAIQGTIAKDAIEGTWEGGGNTGTLSAKKRP